MSKCIYKEIAKSLDKTKLEDYYKTHLPKDVCTHFGFKQSYFIKIFDYLNIPRRTAAENTKIQFKYYDNSIRNKKIGESNKGRQVSQETRLKISTSQKGVKRKPTKTSFKRGNIPRNKGKKGVQHWVEGQKERYYETLRKHNYYSGMSKAEQNYLQELLKKYDKDDIIYQYHLDTRYPFNCDFYIKSKDLFIEINKWRHHGPHPFNPSNLEDIELLNQWKEKAKVSKQYQAAIITRTQRDVKKIKCAKDNNLNYILIY